MPDEDGPGLAGLGEQGRQSLGLVCDMGKWRAGGSAEARAIDGNGGKAGDRIAQVSLEGMRRAGGAVDVDDGRGVARGTLWNDLIRVHLGELTRDREMAGPDRIGVHQASPGHATGRDARTGCDRNGHLRQGTHRAENAQRVPGCSGFPVGWSKTHRITGHAAETGGGHGYRR